MSTLIAQDATFTSGDDVELQFTVTADGTSSGAATTIVSARWSLAKEVGATALLSLDSDVSGIALSGSSTEIATVTLTTTQSALADGAYYHELEITDDNGDIQTVAQGTITVLGGLN